VNDTNERLLQLERACRFAQDADFQAYSQAIKSLRKNPSPEVLAGMLRCLHDADAGEIQYELVEACEAYPDGDYVAAFIDAVPHLRASAPQWGRLMLQSILNTPACTRILITSASAIPAGIHSELRAWIASVATDDNSQYESILDELDRVA
jgi:hypothetical protein